MFDLIEEDLTDANAAKTEERQFIEAENPIYTMPTTYRRERKSGSGDKKLVFIIFSSLFVLAIIGTGVFLFLSQPQSAPANPAFQQAVETPAPEVPSQEQPQMEQQQMEQQPVLESGTDGTLGTSEEQAAATTTQITTPVASQETAVPLLGIDSDQDGLTDSEERLYSTDAQKEDTDTDTYLDGEEIKNLYDPLRPEQSRLDVSGLVNTYTNQTFQYSLLYPSSWVAKSTDPTTDREVMISSATGEFFTITVVDNPNRLSPVDWYASQAAPGSDTSRLQSFTYETWSGVMTTDSQTVYVTRNNGTMEKQTLLYILKYNLNTENELNFISTMQMMLRSFVFTDLSFVK